MRRPTFLSALALLTVAVAPVAAQDLRGGMGAAAVVPLAPPVAPESRPLVSAPGAGNLAVAGRLPEGQNIAVNPSLTIQVPRGYRPAWTDGRLNPYAGKQLFSGALQSSLVWTQTVPRRLKTETGVDVTERYNYLVYPYTDYEKQRAALGSGDFVQIYSPYGPAIVPRAW